MKILLADQQELARNGLRSTMERLSDEVELVEAGTLDEALAKLTPDTTMDLVMLDPGGPSMEGLASLERIRAHRPGLPVILLSATSSERDIDAALDRGAAGYISKSLDFAATLAALRKVLSGEVVDSRTAARAGKIEPPTHFADLSPRERRVLSLLAEGGCNKHIARQLDLQEVTVKAHLRQIFRKLGVVNRTQAVMLVLQSGWSG